MSWGSSSAFSRRACVAARARDSAVAPRPRLIYTLVASALGTSAFGNPVGPQVVSGTASVAASGKTLSITNSPNAILNWQGFSIATDETTRFIQQNAQSAVLNRVVGQNPSQILGALQSKFQFEPLQCNFVTLL